MYRTLTTLIAQNLYASVFHKEIIGFIRLQENEETILDTFDTFIGRMDYYAGLSNHFRELEHINDYLLQAHYMTEHYSQPPYTQNLFFFGAHSGLSASHLHPGNVRYISNPRKSLVFAGVRPKERNRVHKNLRCLSSKRDEHHQNRRSSVHSPYQPYETSGQADTPVGRRSAQSKTRLTYRLCLAMLKNEGMKSFY